MSLSTTIVNSTHFNIKLGAASWNGSSMSNVGYSPGDIYMSSTNSAGTISLGDTSGFWIDAGSNIKAYVTMSSWDGKKITQDFRYTVMLPSIKEAVFENEKLKVTLAYNTSSGEQTVDLNYDDTTLFTDTRQIGWDRALDVMSWNVGGTPPSLDIPDGNYGNHANKTLLVDVNGNSIVATFGTVLSRSVAVTVSTAVGTFTVKAGLPQQQTLTTVPATIDNKTISTTNKNVVVTLNGTDAHTIDLTDFYNAAKLEGWNAAKAAIKLGAANSSGVRQIVVPKKDSVGSTVVGFEFTPQRHTYEESHYTLASTVPYYTTTSKGYYYWIYASTNGTDGRMGGTYLSSSKLYLYTRGDTPIYDYTYSPSSFSLVDATIVAK